MGVTTLRSRSSSRSPLFSFIHKVHIQTVSPPHCRSRSGANISTPTHFFTVLTSCRDSAHTVASCRGELQTVSFLVPHRPSNSESCAVSDTRGSSLGSQFCSGDSGRSVLLPLERRSRICLGGRSHVVPSVAGPRRRVDHRTGLLPGQQSTNPRAAEGEDPPHSCHQKEAMKMSPADLQVQLINNLNK